MDLGTTSHPLTALTVLALVIGLLVRLIKADGLNRLLASYSIPAVPKVALPWVALALGLAGAIVDARIGGATWSQAALAGAWGILAGATAVAGNETLPTIMRPLLPSAAKVVFGAKPAVIQPDPSTPSGYAVTGSADATPITTTREVGQ